MGCGASADKPAEPSKHVPAPPAGKRVGKRNGRVESDKEKGFKSVMDIDGEAVPNSGKGRRVNGRRKQQAADEKENGNGESIVNASNGNGGMAKKKRKAAKKAAVGEDGEEGRKKGRKKRKAELGQEDVTAAVVKKKPAGKHGEMRPGSAGGDFVCPSPTTPMVRVDPAVREFDFAANLLDFLSLEKCNKIDRWLISRGDTDNTKLLCPQEDIKARPTAHDPPPTHLNGQRGRDDDTRETESCSSSVHLRKVSILELTAMIPHDSHDYSNTRSEVNVDARSVRDLDSEPNDDLSMPSSAPRTPPDVLVGTPSAVPSEAAPPPAPMQPRPPAKP